MKTNKKSKIKILFSLFLLVAIGLVLIACDKIPIKFNKDEETIITITYDLNGGRFFNNELNNELVDGKYKITLPKGEKELVPLPENPYKEINGQKHYFKFFYLKQGDRINENKRFHIQKQMPYEVGDYITLSDSITLGVKYNDYPGPTRLNDIMDVLGIDRPTPSIGNVNILVIPIKFETTTNDANFKADLELAFNGTQEETGWHSVSSYFKAVSNEKLNLKFHILDPQESSSTVEEVNDMKTKSKTSFPEQKIIQDAMFAAFKNNTYKELLNNVDSNNNSIFDTNNDGFFDAVYAVYDRNYIDLLDITEGAPKIEDSVWFSYAARNISSDSTISSANGQVALKTLDYAWTNRKLLRKQMFHLADKLYGCANNDYNDKATIGATLPNGKVLNINASYLIHEMAHMMGLFDVFSLSPYMGRSDIMDLYMGDINPFARAIIGWDDPYVYDPSESLYTVIKKWGKETNIKRKSVVIFPKTQNEELSYFDECIIMDYYQTDLTNPTNFEYNNNVSYLSSLYKMIVPPQNTTYGEYNITIPTIELGNIAFKQNAIRIYKVDARMCLEGYSTELVNLTSFGVYKNDNKTTTPIIEFLGRNSELYSTPPSSVTIPHPVIPHQEITVDIPSGTIPNLGLLNDGSAGYYVDGTSYQISWSNAILPYDGYNINFTGLTKETANIEITQP